MSDRHWDPPSPAYVDQDGAPVYEAPAVDVPDTLINADEIDISQLAPEPPPSPGSATPAMEYTGKSVSYYRVSIAEPTDPKLPPYEAECNDIIEALGMSFAEGNAFKAIWRSCAARNLGKSKRGYTDGLYDAEKVVFFGERMVATERRKKR